MPIFVIMEQTHKWKRTREKASSIADDEKAIKDQGKEEFKQRIVPAKIAAALTHGISEKEPPSPAANAAPPPKGDTGKRNDKNEGVKTVEKPAEKPREIPKLKHKWKRFGEEYVIDHNAKDAAIRAGYSEKSADKYGPALAKKREILEYINILEEKVTEKCGIKAIDVLDELKIIGYADIRNYVDVKDGNIFIKDFKDLPAPLTRAIEMVKETRDGLTIKLHSKIPALELMGQHLQLYTQKLALTDEKPVLFEGEDKIPD